MTGRNDAILCCGIELQEVGWDSEKPGYDGLIDVANRLMLARTNSETKDAAVYSISLFLIHNPAILLASITTVYVNFRFAY